jgi:TolB-like protein/Flp pilus assembly protein TadD
VKGNFFSELRRRNVYKVAVAYGVVAWLLFQAASILLPTFEAPSWVMKAFTVFLALGFILAVTISWAFEMTPEGMKRTADVSPDVVRSMPYWSKKKFAAFVIGVAVIAAGLFIFQLLRVPSPTITSNANEKSIAVLPFDNLSEDKSNAFFAEGVQDEILTRLAKVADLKVIARTSTQKFKSSPENLSDVAKQLGVLNILEGSVQKANDQVRVNVQLINATTNAHLWAEIYDRKLTDIFAVESDIAKTIADTLQAKLSGSEKTAISKKPTANPEAYELYLQGRFLWSKRAGPALRRSVDYFNKAIAKDPNYAQAYAGLAQAWAVMSSYNGGSPADSFPQAATAARKALALDATSSDALAALASYKAIYEFDYAGSLKEYERVIQLDPNNATAHHWLATDTLSCIGQQERELAEMKRALELDPLSLIINNNVGMAYLHNGRLDEAIVQLRKALELDGSFYIAHCNYAIVLTTQGKIPDAITEMEKTVAMTDDPAALGQLGQLYGMAGRRDEAQKILNTLREARSQRYTAAYSLALVCLGLGDKTEALKWLEQSYRDRDGNFIGYIRIDPLLKALHGDPRFEALAEKIVPARLFKAVAVSK